MPSVGTIVIGALVIGALVFAIHRMYRNRGVCPDCPSAGDCGGCPMAGAREKQK